MRLFSLIRFYCAVFMFTSKNSVLILDCIPGILIPLNNIIKQVNKHHTADCTVFVLVQERVAYYHHRHRRDTRNQYSPRLNQQRARHQVLKVRVGNQNKKVNKYCKLLVLASDCVTSHYFVSFIRRHLVLNIFPIPLRTAQFIGEFCNKTRSSANTFSHFALFFCVPYAALITLELGFLLCL